jgi:hypothetical protein
MAPLRHAEKLEECPLTGEDRKSPALGRSDAVDPKPDHRNKHGRSNAWRAKLERFV